jgi:hypothetical protein
MNTDSNVIKVLAVTPYGVVSDIGIQAAKSMESRQRYRYSLPVFYTLQDGTKIETAVKGLTKPKLAKRLAAIRNAIDCNCLQARQCYWGGTEYWSFSAPLEFQTA